ncbi:ComF family protein [Stenotrophomonas rhizophila]|uniref:ComF family protein n=1 Tax=Stenotrophomonas rhizophila TaxID=216778 RepID=UPI001E2AE610|nr:ComF family protein [Stenotrophomonas rhizophila]MCC7634432.1 ComF family protein [Stenotrophomonas rhizophila]MCC7663830.1 ComF family protein [Stenotrophomonas rhizophila]
MRARIAAALDWLGRQTLPLRCLVCDEAGSDGLDLCADCHAALPWNDAACPGCALPLPADEPAARCGACLREPPRQAAAAAAFVYTAPVDQLLLRFKFHQDLAAGRLLSQLMLQRVPAFASGALLPLPLHRQRLRARGYDQALELARPLARSLQCPLWHGLSRERLTAPQSDLDADARRRNVRNAFTVTAGPPSRLTVVDDVMTTGATLDAAVRALRRAGAAQVHLWVCARVP